MPPEDKGAGVRQPVAVPSASGSSGPFPGRRGATAFRPLPVPRIAVGYRPFVRVGLACSPLYSVRCPGSVGVLALAGALPPEGGTPTDHGSGHLQAPEH